MLYGKISSSGVKNQVSNKCQTNQGSGAMELDGKSAKTEVLKIQLTEIFNSIS